MIWNYYHFKKPTMELGHFQKLIFIQKWWKKNCHLLRQLYAFIITSYRKNCSKIHSYEKVFFFGKMDIWYFSKVIMLAHCISFAPFWGFPNMENGHNRFLKSKAKGQVFNPLTWHLFAPTPQWWEIFWSLVKG